MNTKTDMSTLDFSELKTKVGKMKHIHFEKETLMHRMNHQIHESDL